MEDGLPCVLAGWEACEEREDYVWNPNEHVPFLTLVWFGYFSAF